MRKYLFFLILPLFFIAAKPAFAFTYTPENPSQYSYGSVVCADSSNGVLWYARDGIGDWVYQGAQTWCTSTAVDWLNQSGLWDFAGISQGWIGIVEFDPDTCSGGYPCYDFSNYTWDQVDGAAGFVSKQAVALAGGSDPNSDPNIQAAALSTITGFQGSMLNALSVVLPIAAVALISVILIYFIIRNFRKMSGL